MSIESGCIETLQVWLGDHKVMYCSGEHAKQVNNVFNMYCIIRSQGYTF